MAYASIEMFKAYLRIPESDEIDDAELTRALATASTEVDQICSRTFTPPAVDPVTRFSYPIFDRKISRWVVPIADLFDLTDMTVDTWTAANDDWTTDVPVADLRFRPLNAAVQGEPYEAFILPGGASFPSVQDTTESLVKVTARFGWPAVPAQVEEATLIQAARVFKRRDATFGIVSDPAGTESARLKSLVDVDAVLALQGLVKQWGAR